MGKGVFVGATVGPETPSVVAIDLVPSALGQTFRRDSKSLLEGNELTLTARLVLAGADIDGDEVVWLGLEFPITVCTNCLVRGTVADTAVNPCVARQPDHGSSVRSDGRRYGLGDPGIHLGRSARARHVFATWTCGEHAPSSPHAPWPMSGLTKAALARRSEAQLG